MRAAALILAAACAAAPAAAQPSEGLPIPRPDRPMFTRAYAPICETRELVLEWSRRTMEPGDEPIQLKGCFFARPGIRAAFVDADTETQTIRVVLVTPDKDGTGWTTMRGLTNEPPPPPQRGAASAR
jgi:hypothetical protein